ncbi:MAG: SUMF1/EgtB/PvdO family nonheme iron enzyme [Bacteroidales bacterium]|nr:SUMF1/EgtB/PvdO family nonheme iron enzyme [Bacteroidales bacterium]
MKRILIISFVLILFSYGCGSYNGGELVGVSGRKSYPEPDPFGMVYIPQGYFTMGQNDDDINWALHQSSVTVSVPSFWMDETEITNNEYRQFTDWVRDSVVRKKLAIDLPERFSIVDKAGDELLDVNDQPRINYDYDLDLEDEEINTVYEEFVYGVKDRLFGKKEFDTRKLIYRFYWTDFNLAAKARNSFNFNTKSYDGYDISADGTQIPISDRQDFIREDEVHVYPDTLVWVRDFSYSYNEPYTTQYFWHPQYDQYPVVGVTQKQARAFCIFRTNLLNNALLKARENPVADFRLPSEAEWEYAARGGIDLGKYPHGGPYLRNVEGCFLANYKPMRGNYIDDGGYKTLPVGSYEANGYNLWDMAGNVAEWTANAFDETTYSFSHDMSPGYVYNAKSDDPASMKRKVVRGGSWKDIGYFLQCGVRSYEYQDSAKSYIGFRCVRDFMGVNNFGN